MNILQVVQFFSPVHGGSSRGTYDLSKELAKRGHDVTLYTSDYRLSWEWVKSLSKVNVYPFKTRSNLAEFYVTPGIMNHMGEEIKHFDMIHLHNYRTFQNIVVSRCAKKYNVPYVLAAHGSLPRIVEKHRLKWIYDVSFGYESLRNASNVIALNQTEAQQYRDMGVPEEKIAIMPNGIDLTQYANLPPKGSFKKKFNIEDKEKIVLYLGRIHRIKGIDILLRSFARLNEKSECAKLVIAGPDDGYLSACKRLATKLKIENRVLFTGALFGVEKLKAYVDADVFVLPSRYEIFGNVVLESYACSKPVIATKVGGLKDLVFHGKTGLLVELGDVKGLFSAIINLLTDDETRINMGIRGRRMVEEKFSLEKIVDKLEATYCEIVKVMTDET